jgi:hypothetical protein
VRQGLTTWEELTAAGKALEAERPGAKWAMDFRLELGRRT